MSGTHATAVRALMLAASATILTISVGSKAQTGGDNPGSTSNVATASNGEQTYGEVCKACHMANAQGGTGAGAIPALAHNSDLANADYVTRTLLKGHGGMPAFKDVLTFAQIAGVATYIRTHFNNNYSPPVTVADVGRVANIH